MGERLDWLKRKLGIHIHQREMFCVGVYAFVKCIDPKCRMESMPWEVPLETAKAWKETNGGRLQILYDLERARNEGEPPSCPDCGLAQGHPGIHRPEAGLNGTNRGPK